MGERSAIRSATLTAVAAEMAGHPIDAAQAEGFVPLLGMVMQGIDALRQLPLKDIEPITVFVPVETPAP